MWGQIVKTMFLAITISNYWEGQKEKCINDIILTFPMIHYYAVQLQSTDTAKLLSESFILYAYKNVV